MSRRQYVAKGVAGGYRIWDNMQADGEGFYDGQRLILAIE